MSRPRIAVAGVARNWEGQPRVGVNANYVRAVLAAGGLPIIFVPDLSREETIELFSDCDGLLLTGGEDVDPQRYGAVPHPKLGAIDPRRDENELSLITEARARDLPILGICRGIQILNVAFKGTLTQDLATQRPGTINHDTPDARDVRTHAIAVTETSRLAEILGETEFSANSFHHQAIDQIGDGLTACAVAPDGVIEAVESADPHEWIVAVQWHPEELAHQPDAADLKLFAALVKAARCSLIDPFPTGSAATSLPRVVHLASGREWRGGQRQVLILAAGLVHDANVDSVVVTGKGTELAKRLVAANVPIFEVPWALGLDPRVAVNAMSALRPGAIIHAHDSHSHALADAISRMRDTPIVVTRRVTTMIKNPRRYKSASAVIAISTAVRDLLLRAGVSGERIHLIPDAVDIAHVTAQRDWPAALPPVSAGTPLIVCVAALTKEKGVDLLIDAAAILRQSHPDARWLVLGDGPDREALEARSTANGTSDVVQLAGFVNAPEAVVRTATVVVQPSHAEGLGSSVLDALALGVPVVATRVGGLPDALAHGGGVLVAPNAPVELAAAVARLLNDESARARIGAAGRLAAREFSNDRLVEKTLDVYRSIGETRGDR